jgi:thioredoxin reductase (NADPH)
VHVWRGTEVCELKGDLGLEEVVVCDLSTDDRRALSTTALFVMIGSDPHTRWLDGAIELDDRGFVLTGAGVDGTALFETSSVGVFAVGDVRSGSVKRVASAVGEGAVVVRLVHEHLTRTGRR